MKQAIIVGGWFISTVITLLVSISTVHLLTNTRQVAYYPDSSINHPEQPILSYNHLVGSVLGDSTGVTSADARPELLSLFLKRYNSPLKPYDYWGDFLVNLADKHQLDYRLLPAMAMQESNLCKKIPAGSYNCLGLGIHSQGTWGFDNYEKNFEKAAEILKKNYVDKGLVSPEEIQTKYTPHSNGSWQFAVNQFINKIEKGDF